MVSSRAAAQISCFHFDQRVHPQLPRLPWLGTCADETKRSKTPYPSTMGRLDFDAGVRSRRPHRKRLAEILPRASGHQFAAIGLPVPRTRQVADHSRLAAGCRAIVRPLDISGASHRAGAPATNGPPQVRRRDLRLPISMRRAVRLRPPAREPKTSVRCRPRTSAPTSRSRAPAP